VTVDRTSPFNLVKVFVATTAEGRDWLGQQVSRWIAAHPEASVVDAVVRQSSDRRVHCLSITLFCIRDLNFGAKTP
jgi:hypothetical protein